MLAVSVGLVLAGCAGSPSAPTPGTVADDALECGLVGRDAMGDPVGDDDPMVARVAELWDGLPARSATAEECFADAVATGTPAILHRARTTIEGDPILEVISLRDDGRVDVVYDTRYDEFGAGGVVRLVCAGWDVAIAEPTGCE